MHVLTGTSKRSEGEREQVVIHLEQIYFRQGRNKCKSPEMSIRLE